MLGPRPSQGRGARHILMDAESGVVTVSESGSDFRNRLDKIEDRLARDVVDARLFSAEMRGIRENIQSLSKEITVVQSKLEGIEKDRKEIERDQAKTLKTLFYSIIITLVSVLFGAIIMVLRTGGI